MFKMESHSKIPTYKHRYFIHTYKSSSSLLVRVRIEKALWYKIFKGQRLLIFNWLLPDNISGRKLCRLSRTKLTRRAGLSKLFPRTLVWRPFLQILCTCSKVNSILKFPGSFWDRKTYSKSAASLMTLSLEGAAKFHFI